MSELESTCVGFEKEDAVDTVYQWVDISNELVVVVVEIRHLNLFYDEESERLEIVVVDLDRLRFHLRR